MKGIIFILVAVQILRSSGQSLKQAVDDSINKLNEDSELDYLVAATGYEATGVVLTDQGLQVNLTLNVQETECTKEDALFLASCELTHAKTITCKSMLRYANCMIKNVEITCSDNAIDKPINQHQPSTTMATTTQNSDSDESTDSTSNESVGSTSNESAGSASNESVDSTSGQSMESDSNES